MATFRLTTGNAIWPDTEDNSGDDILDGGDNADLLYGSDGNDVISSGSVTSSADRLYGEGGNDTLIVDNGNDYANLYGGAGTDTFVIGGDHSAVTIADFTLGETLTFNNLVDYSVNGSVATLTDGTVLTFTGLTSAQVADVMTTAMGRAPTSVQNAPLPAEDDWTPIDVSDLSNPGVMLHLPDGWMF